MFKSIPDPLWHASVLEGLATVPILDAWASGVGLVISTSHLCSPSHEKTSVEWFHQFRQGSLDRSRGKDCASFGYILEDHTRSRPRSTVPILDVPVHYLRPSPYFPPILCLVGQRLGACCICDTTGPWADSVYPSNPCSSRSIVFRQPGAAFYYFGYQTKPNIRGTVTSPWTMVTASRFS